MGFQLPDGKTARNIQEQVKFLTEKLRDLYARVNDLEFHIEVVDELPEEGQEGIIYLVPAEDPDEGNYYEEYLWIDGEWELIGTTQIDLSGYATLAGDQTFSGDNTFSNNIIAPGIEQPSGALMLGKSGNDINASGTIKPATTDLRDLGSSTYKWKDLYLSGKIIHSSSITLSPSEVDSYYVGQYNFLPVSNQDLGSSSYQWRDLYLSRNLTDGTNSVSVANIANGIFNVINASDIVSNTLTQAQYDLITNGKPTLIKGILRSDYINPLLVNLYEYSGTMYGIIISSGRPSRIATVSISTSSKVIAIESSPNIRLEGIDRINGKVIPTYPTSNTVPQILTIGANGGSLSWGNSLTDLTITGNISDGLNSVSVATLAALSGAHLYKHTIACDNDVITIINGSSAPLNMVTSIVAAFPSAVRFLFYYHFRMKTSVVLSVGSDSVEIIDEGSALNISIDNYDSIVDTVSAYN